MRAADAWRKIAGYLRYVLFGGQMPERLPTEGASIAQHSECLRSAFPPSKYYEYLRKEIEREDNITNQRLTWAMAFQGFLITAMTFLLSSGWANQPTEIEVFRKLAVGAVGVVGLCVAILSTAGADASRDALDQVISDWEMLDKELHIIPKLAPRTYGGGNPYKWGSRYARLIPRLFAAMWFVYVIAYGVIIVPKLNPFSVHSPVPVTAGSWCWNRDWADKARIQHDDTLPSVKTTTE